MNEKASDEKGLVLYNPTTLKEVKFDDSLLEEFREHEKFLLKVFGWTQTLRDKYGYDRLDELCTLNANDS